MGAALHGQLVSQEAHHVEFFFCFIEDASLCLGLGNGRFQGQVRVPGVCSKSFLTFQIKSLVDITREQKHSSK